MDMTVPKGEVVWVTYYDMDHKIRFIITSKANDRSYYYIYLVDREGHMKKLGKSSSPQELAEKYVNRGEKRTK